MNIRKKNKNMLDKYWEEQLNIDYDIEYEYYKKLCGKKYNPNLLRKKYNVDDECLSYSKWKSIIKDQIKELDRSQLKEYSRYLEQKYRECENTFNLSQTLLVPFLISLVGVLINIFIEPALKSIFEKSDNFFIIFYVMIVLMIFMMIFSKLISIKKDSTRGFFYQDMKEIINEEIDNIN